MPAGGRRSSTPSTSRCASTPGIFDLSAFAIFDVQGAGALEALQRAVLRADGRAGRAGRLHAGADARRRVQVRPHDHAARRRGVPRRHRRRARHGRPQAVRRPAARRRLGLARRRDDGLDDDRPLGAAGARHPRERSPPTTSRTRASRSARAARSRSARSSCSPRASPTSATSAGSCTCRSSRARGCGTCSGRPARRTALTACGIGVYGTTGRLEKGYRAYGAELETEYNVVEAGMQRPKVKEQDFVGKEAHLRHRDEEPAAVLCTLTVDDHTSAARRQALSARPRADHAARRRRRSPTRKGRRSYVTSAGAGPSLGTVHPARLPAARARGRGLAGARGRVHGRALPGHGRRRRRDARLRSRECEDPVVKVLVCVKRVPHDRRRGSCSPTTSRRSRPGTSASRSARTRSAASRRPSGSSSSTAASRSCSPLGPADALEQLRDAMAIGIDRAHPPRDRRRGVGSRGDGGRDRRRRSAPTRPPRGRST